MTTQHLSEKNAPVVLITGSARRVGACIATTFHDKGYRVIIHYRQSRDEAFALATTLNQHRAESAVCIAADLDDFNAYEKLIHDSYNTWHRLDVLINNASTFTPTPVGDIKADVWDYLFNSNLKAPFYLSQAAAPFLRENQGNIINIVDIHAITPMKNYPIYSCAKAGLLMLTKSLALELAPSIRVNAVAPGSVIWPENENEYADAKKQAILSATLLKKQVDPTDIAKTALFLAEQTSMTGQMLNVDAGRLI